MINSIRAGIKIIKNECLNLGIKYQN